MENKDLESLTATIKKKLAQEHNWSEQEKHYLENQKHFIENQKHFIENQKHWTAQQKQWKWVVLLGFIAILVNGFKSLWGG